MEYQQYDVSDELAQCIKCKWTLEAPDTDQKQRQNIMPDGCLEMIFHYGDLYKQYTGQFEYSIQPRCFVFGQISRPLEIEPIDKIGNFSVRFHPDGFMPFFFYCIGRDEQ